VSSVFFFLPPKKKKDSKQLFATTVEEDDGRKASATAGTSAGSQKVNPTKRGTRAGATSDGGPEKTPHGAIQIIPLTHKRETTNLTRWPENAGTASEEQNLIPIANARSIRDKKENQSH